MKKSLEKMLRYPFFYLLSGLISLQASTITFVVRTPTLPEGQRVYITGNTDNLGRWAPNVHPMKHTNGVWYIQRAFPYGSAVEYKFTLGDWQQQALNEKGKPYTNFRMAIREDAIQEHTIEAWNTAPAGITGELRYHRDLKGEGILPRDVLVWLPKAYAENPEQHFPVVYMHDAQQLFDPATATHGKDWQVDETITRLVADQSIEPVIVVGTTSTENRFQEYGDTETGRYFRQFMVDVLKPFIDQTYRTQPEREHTAVMGSSMGGLLSFLLLRDYPQTYSKAACFSPAFMWNWKDYFNWNPQTENIMLYLDNGGVDLEQLLQPGIDTVLNTLPEKGFVWGENAFWTQDKAAPHNEAAWAKRFPTVMQLFFNTKDTEELKQNLRNIPLPLMDQLAAKNPEHITHPASFYKLMDSDIDWRGNHIVEAWKPLIKNIPMMRVGEQPTLGYRSMNTTQETYRIGLQIREFDLVEPPFEKVTYPETEAMSFYFEGGVKDIPLYHRLIHDYWFPINRKTPPSHYLEKTAPGAHPLLPNCGINIIAPIGE